MEGMFQVVEASVRLVEAGKVNGRGGGGRGAAIRRDEEDNRTGEGG